MNPYLLDLPAVVSFSGGRTSGFLLRNILDAHSGQPDDLRVCFQNTGLEHAATYDFVREVAERWSVRVDWIEYQVDEDGSHAFRVTDHDGASRDGAPFTALIRKKKYLPNPVTRICTTNLKMRSLDRFLKSLPAFADGYTNAVGLRYDEPRRVHRMKSDNGRERVVCPMYDARHTEEDVLAFWSASDFDLMLPLHGNMAGNCVGCFLKSRSKLEVLMEEMPEYFDWWVQAEADVASTGSGGLFRQDRPSYKDMLANVQAQGSLFPRAEGDENAIPCFCTD